MSYTDSNLLMLLSLWFRLITAYVIKYGRDVIILPHLYHRFIVSADPHIKVSGDPENVKRAKDMIMAVLDTKVSSITSSN